MVPLLALGAEFVITLLVGVLLIAYLRNPLYRMLLDLCGTEDRARFWLAFCAVLLVGIPSASALGYQPLPGDLSESLLLVLQQLGRNIAGFLAALVGLGFVLSFFTLVTSRTSKEPKS